MLGIPVPDGALFYGQTRRRVAVAFDVALRALTASTAKAARANILASRTPPPVVMPGCRACSLRENCQPERLQRPPDVATWLRTQLGE